MSDLIDYVAKQIALSDAVTKNKRNTLADMIVAEIRKFIAVEREECAKVADDQHEIHWENARQCSVEHDTVSDIQQMKCGVTCEVIAKRIRARGAK